MQQFRPRFECDIEAQQYIERLDVIGMAVTVRLHRAAGVDPWGQPCASRRAMLSAKKRGQRVVITTQKRGEIQVLPAAICRWHMNTRRQALQTPGYAPSVLEMAAMTHLAPRAGAQGAARRWRCPAARTRLEKRAENLYEESASLVPAVRAIRGAMS